METVLRHLREDFPAVAFAGGDRSEGVWLQAVDEAKGFLWVRHRMASPETAEALLREAMAAHGA